MWPDYTTLLTGLKANEIGLTCQVFELQNVFRHALELTACCFRFKNAFPSLSERSRWNRAALLKICNKSVDGAQGERKVMYQTIQERIVVDQEYFDAISSRLVGCPLFLPCCTYHPTFLVQPSSQHPARSCEILRGH